ncbi:DedA family protein [Desulfolucanica intricata]|uniref:DedA family protein n=1 Tax=Desulfolucanica intricata TaxID=1285191 RepID=UPI00082A36E6|nr:DedA family protein [Desulfolucanica intricata]
MKELILNYLSTLGILGLFGGVLIESLGVPFPGGPMIILAGFLVGQGRLNFYYVLAVAILGYVLGSTFAYLMGKHIGEPFFIRCGKYLHITPQAFKSAQDKFEHSSAAIIILGRFIPGLSNVSPYLAGVSHLELWKFVLYNAIFALLWIALYLQVGMFFGNRWNVISDKLQIGLPVLALGLLVIYFGIVVLKKWIKKKHFERI